MEPCLTPEQIEAFVADAMLPEQRVKAEAHLKACERCRAAVAARRTETRLAGDIRRAHQAPTITRPHGPAAGTNAETPIIGDTIEGYEIIGEIHRGGQGVVYKAVQKATKRTVALKMLLQGPYASAKQQHRFEREIDLVASLQHPNIVTIYDSGVTQGRHYFAMEYIHGQSLDTHLSNNNLSIDETLRLFQTICSAVNYAHQRGVIHRDLKPDNIRIDAQGEPHVLDFGLAKAAGADLSSGIPVTVTGEFMGTLAYASPEQTKGDPGLIDIRTDVYSLGVILYEMLTGKYPYLVVGQMAEVLRNIAETEPNKPSTIRRQINNEVETIVLKALTKEREHRYQSAEGLGRDIQRYLDGEPIEAKRQRVWYVLWKSLLKHRLAGMVVLGFALVILASSVVAWTLYIRADKEKRSALAANVEAAEAKDEAIRQATSANLAVRELRRASFATQMTLEAIIGWNQKKALGSPPNEQDYTRFSAAKMQEMTRAIDRMRDKLNADRSMSKLNQNTPGSMARVVSCVAKPEPGDDHYAFWERYYGPRKAAELVGAIQRGEHDKAERLNAGEWTELDPELVKDFDPSKPPTRWIPATTTGKAVVHPDADGEIDSVVIGALVDGIRKLAEKAGKRASRRGMYSIARPNFRPVGPEAILLSFVDTNYGGLLVMGGTYVDDFVTKLDVTTICMSQGTDKNNPGGAVIIDFMPYRVVNMDVPSLAGELCRHRVLVRELDLSGLPDNLASVRLEDPFFEAVYELPMSPTGPDGTRIVSQSQDITMKLGGAPTGAPTDASTLTLRGHEDDIRSVGFSPDGTRIVSGSDDKTVKIWDAATGEITMTLRGHEDGVRSVAFSPDGTRIVSGSNDKTLKIWNATTGANTLTLSGHEDIVFSVAFSPDSTRIVSGSIDETVKVWDVATGDNTLTLRGHEDGVSSVGFSPDSTHIISGSWDRTLKLWDVATGEELLTLRGHSESVTSLGFSPDGARIVSGGGWDKTVKVWNAATRENTLTLRGHESGVSSVAFSPDGTHIVSGSWDKTVKIWDAATGENTLTLRGHEEWVHSVAFSPDDTRIVTGSADDIVKVWNVAKPTTRSTTALSETQKSPSP